MAIRLTKVETEIVNYLKSGLTISITAQRMNRKDSTVQIHLHRLRAKYKEARKFVNQIESLRTRYPLMKQYLRTRETE